MPRSWHSSTEYFICRSTGLPQMSQTSTRFLLITPQRWQLLEALERAALALPVADRELHEIERTGLPEIAEGEDAREDRLQAGVLALLGEQVHLQEALVRAALHVDEVRQRHVRPDLGEVVADRLLLGHGSVHSDDSFICGVVVRQGSRQATPRAGCAGLGPRVKGPLPPFPVPQQLQQQRGIPGGSSPARNRCKTLT